MRSLVNVLEDATARSAFEVVIGSEHAAVFTTPWGRELERHTSPGAALFDMLAEVISSEQQIELAVGNPVELTLDTKTERWNLRATSGSEGISIHARCPELAPASDDVPLAVPRRSPSAALVSKAPLDTGTSGRPFDDCWTGETEQQPPATASEEPLELEGSPVYVAATDSTIQGLPSSDEALPDDAVVLVPELILKAAAEPRPPEGDAPQADTPRSDAERSASDTSAHLDEPHALLATQAATIAKLETQLAQYARALNRHERAIRQLHKRLMSLEREAERGTPDASGETG